MNAFEAIAQKQANIEAELARVAKEEGFDSVPEFTEHVLLDHLNKAIWFQLRDKGYLTWITNDYPQYAAPFETCVGADDEEEALSYKSDRS